MMVCYCSVARVTKLFRCSGLITKKLAFYSSMVMCNLIDCNTVAVVVLLVDDERHSGSVFC